MRNDRTPRIYYLLFKKQFHPAILLLLLAIAMIIWGITLKENAETQRNARFLCLDCLGIS
ncbi:MAG: hypothetical protein RAO92_08180 [Candidatus Euphemobacter frigidus]|nr:hypothetical protein [Candidatus Euphemobacter frigidus]MDP8276365.1 hypothetical protein [Candidatus Euphemobacter frigidus]